MKIVYLGRYNPTEILTGPEKVAKRLFHNMKVLNPESIFIEYFFDGKKHSIFRKLFGRESFNNDGQEIIRLGLVPIFLFLLRYRPDYIHIIKYERFCLIAYLYKIFNKVKILYTVHGIIIYENEKLRDTPFLLKIKDRFVEIIIYRYSDMIVFLSKVSVQSASKYYMVEENKTTIIPNGIDEEYFLNSDSKVYNTNVLKGVFVGNYFRKEKGFESLFQVANNVDVPFELFIVSVGMVALPISVESKLIIHFVEKMSTHDFAGFLQDKDIFISASSYDNFSIACAEAVAAGLIPIVTKQTGISEYINHNKNGFIIDCENLSVINNCINMLSTDSNLLSDLIKNSKNIFSEMKWSKIAEQYFSLYNKLNRD